MFICFPWIICNIFYIGNVLLSLLRHFKSILVKKNPTFSVENDFLKHKCKYLFLQIVAFFHNSIIVCYNCKIWSFSHKWRTLLLENSDFILIILLYIHIFVSFFLNGGPYNSFLFVLIGWQQESWDEWFNKFP